MLKYSRYELLFNQTWQNMKTTLSNFLVFLILIWSCTNQSGRYKKEFTLKGEIIGQDSGQVILRYLPTTYAYVYDTVKILNGKFIIKGKIFETTKARITVDNLNNLEIYLDPGVLEITLFKDRFEDYKMVGSKTYQELIQLNSMEEPLTTRLTQIRKLLSVFNDSIKNSNSDTRLQLVKKVEEINKMSTKARESLDSVRLKFVLNNPKSYLSGEYLSTLESNEIISLDSLKLVFNRLDKPVQNSLYGNYIKEDIRKKENIQIGKLAPDFTAPDFNNQVVKLSNFLGKSVVLLDFWASWCVPCRQEIPELKTTYEKYHQMGFEIIAISLDWDKNRWKSAIKEDSTEIWYQIPVVENYPFNLKDPNQLADYDVYKNYFVQAIPFKILIDKNGKIAGRWGGGLKDPIESLENKLEILLKE
jgi:peroxiredoxin